MTPKPAEQPCAALDAAEWRLRRRQALYALPATRPPRGPARRAGWGRPSGAEAGGRRSRAAAVEDPSEGCAPAQRSSTYRCPRASLHAAARRAARRAARDSRLLSHRGAAGCGCGDAAGSGRAAAPAQCPSATQRGAAERARIDAATACNGVASGARRTELLPVSTASSLSPPAAPPRRSR